VANIRYWSETTLWSRTVAIDVYLSFEHSVFVLKHISISAQSWPKKGDFLQWIMPSELFTALSLIKIILFGGRCAVDGEEDGDGKGDGDGEEDEDCKGDGDGERGIWRWEGGTPGEMEIERGGAGDS
jgi:hypothetical protein